MKQLLLLPIVALMLLASCSSEIQDNTPAMQSRVNDSLFFKATDVRAFYNDQGNLIIRGINDSEMLVFNLFPPFTSQSSVGDGSRNVAAFTDENGRVFSTANTDVSGILRPLVNDDFVTLRFNLTATRPGIGNTKVFSEGIAYEVPLVSPFTDDMNDPDAVEDSFSARVNTVSFNPTVTAAAVSGGNLSLVGETSNASIRLNFPSNTGAGTYEFASTGAFVGIYRVMDMDNLSQSGSLNIISNDTDDRIIMGEFTFETGDFSVTEGRFTLNY